MVKRESRTERERDRERIMAKVNAVKVGRLVLPYSIPAVEFCIVAEEEIRLSRRIGLFSSPLISSLGFAKLATALYGLI